mmetsp:Transcript_31306/g.82954  ORF Transcript_31306/g.82954 Transcript_31306/m.82954 type:complete len:80 (-) Transcript_31306:65-304(-)
MGGGNAQKTAIARAKNAAKDVGSGGGGKDGAAKRTTQPSHVCKICMQSFPATQIKAAQAHVENKHSKEVFATCFPEFTA